MKRKYEETQDTSQSKLDLLPIELKLDIVTRLPGKSVVSLRCVSKSWSSFTRSPELVRSFFSISSTRPRLIVGLSNGLANGDDDMLTFFFSFSPDDESSSLAPSFDMAIPYTVFSNWTGVCPSVHGFLGVETSCGLWVTNPSTEQYLKLPRFTRYVGYDPIDQQYKALSITLMDQYQNGERTTSYDHKVLTLGDGGGWRLIDPPTTTFYTRIPKGVSIDGSIYYGANSPCSPNNPGIVCFDVRSEKLTYIKAPTDVVLYGRDSSYIEYKGKFASIVCDPYGHQFESFALWVLEDADKHEWSKQICGVPPSVWEFFGASKMSFPGTNKAGEIIMAPRILSSNVQPFYIFYYNVETRNIRRVRLLGIGDNQEFRRSYGFEGNDECHVRIAPHHIETIAFFKNPAI